MFRNRSAHSVDDVSGSAGPDRASHRGLLRRVSATLVVLFGLLLVQGPSAAADPVDPATVPAHLRQYVPDSAEWQTSPWMRSEACREHGGDWSTYTAYLIKDFPDLLEFFQPDFAGTDDNAGPRKDLLVRGYRDLAVNLTVPSGYCIDQMKRWAKPNPTFQPFGFEWGNVDTGSDHGVRPWSRCSRTDQGGAPDAVAPCRGFYISCDGAITQQDDQSCQAWNAFSDDYVQRMNTVLHKAFTQYAVVVDGREQTRTCYGCKSPAEVAQEFLNWVAKKGMEQVTSFIVSGITKLWAVFMTIAVDYSSPNLGGAAFASVYNLIAGIALALAFLGWLVTLATSWKRGRLQFSLLGGIKAAVGVTLAGVGAILMLQLADECTMSLISAGGDIAQQADFTTSLVKANPLVAILVGLIAAVSLLFAIVFLVLSPALDEMWALFGAAAAAGQVHETTADWVWRWAARLTALAWAKFFMVGVMLLAQALLMPLEPGEDPARQVVDVVQGLALCLVLVLCPWLLWELVDFIGDRVGGPAASGGTASRGASTGTRRGASMTGSAVRTAVTAMVSTAADIGRGWRDGNSTGQTGSGRNAGSTPTPRPENHSDPRTGGAGTGDTTPGTSSGQSHQPGQVTSVGSGGGNDEIPTAKPPANLGRVVASSQSATRQPATNPTSPARESTTVNSPTRPPPP